MRKKAADKPIFEFFVIGKSKLDNSYMRYEETSLTYSQAKSFYKNASSSFFYDKGYRENQIIELSIYGETNHLLWYRVGLI